MRWARSSPTGRIAWSPCTSSARTRVVEERAAEAARDFADYVRGFARARRGDLGDDLVSQLLIAESDGGKLSEDELVATVILLLNAGHEATVQAIGNGVKAMLEQGSTRAPHSRAKARPRRRSKNCCGSTRRCISLPAMRWRMSSSPACDCTRMRRSAYLLGAANRDPERFPNPDIFDPGRTPNAHVSFGAGIHFCVGAPLARLELAVALPILFARLPGLRLAGTSRYRDAFHFHGLAALRVEWV